MRIYGIRSKFLRYPDVFELKTFLLFLVTAICEIAGCHLPYLWLKQGGECMASCAGSH